jgi:microcystin-dependent protein
MNLAVNSRRALWIKGQFCFMLAVTSFLACFVLTWNAHAEIISSDRRVDWSGNAGLNFAIPSWSNTRNAKTDDGALGDGVTDDTAAINRCIANASSNSCCYLPAGTYKVTATINLANQKCLKGAGPDNTTINAVGLTGDVLSASTFGNGGWMTLTSGYTKGSTRIYVDARDPQVPGYALGELVMIQQTNGEVDEGTPGYMGGTVGQINETVAKGSDGNGGYLDLSRPLNRSLSAAYSPQVSRFYAYIKNVGVQDLKITRSGGSGGNNIRLSACKNCWVQNVKSYDVWNWHVKLESTYGCVVRDSWFEQVNQLNCGGNSCYGATVYALSTDNLIENNVFVKMRHALITEYGGTGNIYGYNYSINPINENGNSTDWLMGDLELHGGHPYMNLFESNVIAHVHAAYTLGSAAYNTFLRNNATARAQAAVKYNLNAVDNGWANFYHNYVGNVYGTSGFTTYDRAYRSPWGCSDDACSQADARLVNGATLLRHGNYSFKQDLGNSGTGYVEWDAAVSDRTMPNSYYYASRPAWYPASLAWPAIGPDVPGYVKDIPAKVRFDTGGGGIVPGGPVATLAAPQNLRLGQ